MSKLITIRDAAEILEATTEDVERYIRCKDLTLEMYDNIIYLKELEVLKLKQERS